MLFDCCMCLLSILSKTKGRARHKITWWWNKETELAVKNKRRAYELWKKSGLEVDKVAYGLAKGRSKRVVAMAQDEERQRYCDMLEEEDGKGTTHHHHHHHRFFVNYVSVHTKVRV